MSSSMAILTTIVICLLATIDVKPAPSGIVEQENHSKIACWESKVSGNLESGFQLSSEEYTLCSYMPSPANYEQGYVNGVDLESDDYSHVLGLLSTTTPGYSMLSVCIHEAFTFRGNLTSTQYSIRCLCNRSGCNIPSSMDNFFTFNQSPIFL
ncbi:hypothetical protein CRE_19134 [Caenorhabditis remanei]|uniref:Uncharacterized protein n=1 Tax=Caenorhabditis remanei TaxID=31234 RepID=E3MJH4_CAERE|nr:hypothetical protein CRE_19134 [Caenorhabditis remanei]